VNSSHFDAIIVGSGFGAGPPALRLATAGLKVLVLEKGPEIVPRRDFRQTQDPRYLLQWLHGVDGPHFGMMYAEGLGGGSGFFEMVALRAPSRAFEQVIDGRKLWPVGLDRPAMDPWYDGAERMMHVRQIRPEAVPASGRVFARMLDELGYTCERARYAESGCVNSGFCVTGCIYNAKKGPLNTYIPAAREAGAEYRCDADVTGIARLSGGGYRIDVRYGAAAESERLRTPLLILGAGTVGTARLLMRSRRDLRLASEHVGRNIAWNGGTKAACLLADDLPDGDMFVGRTHAGVICYDFLESHGVTISAVKAMPLMAMASLRLRQSPSDLFWGQTHVDLMRQMRRRMLALYAMGLAPPVARLRMHRGGRISTELTVTPDLMEYFGRNKKLMNGLFERRGCRPLHLEGVTREGMPHDDFHCGTAHQVGSCRMADLPEDGVCDPAGQVWGLPGLYIADGSAVPSSLAVNPCLTITANSERITHGILEHLGVGTDRTTARPAASGPVRAKPTA
jgi:choline dehydrogenase-like flavoprotein